MENTQHTILVVDDTPANVKLLRSLLLEQGYRVRVATNGNAALTSAQGRPPDVILLDIRMPDMNGYEVCEQLQTDEYTRDIPVIFLSALKEPLDKVKAFSSGGVDYVTKPFEAEAVLARVKTHLTLSQLRKELQQMNEDLERKVRERTAELEETNTELQLEIAERKKVEQALRQAKEAAEAANSAKTALLANVSHEFRTPLNSVLGFAQVLKSHDGLTDEQIAYIKAIEKGGNRLLKLVTDILEVSRFEAQEITLHETDFDLSDSVLELAEEIREHARQKDLEFAYKAEADLPAGFHGDKERICQVLSNVLHNAAVHCTISCMKPFPASADSQKQLADYAMTVDLLNSLVRATHEVDAIKQIITIFRMLFAPQELVYVFFNKGKPGEMQGADSLSPEIRAVIRERVTGLDHPSAWTESGKGFLLRIEWAYEILGVLYVDNVLFPEHKTHYLNLALSIAGVCGLAINNCTAC